MYIMKSTIAFLATLLIFFFAPLKAQENPFIEMAGKPYADNWRQLLKEYYRFLLLDVQEEQIFMQQIEEVAQKTGSLEWRLEVEYFESVRSSNRMKENMDDAALQEKYLNILSELLKKAEKASIRHLELRVRQMMIDYWWQLAPVHNYELCFELYAIQMERLRDVSSKEIPDIANYYEKYANAYSFFKEYDKAISYYKMAIKESDEHERNFLYNYAYNGLGLCYAFCNDYDRSDSCFNAILQIEFLPDEESTREQWVGIAEGNLGSNRAKQGDYAHAIPLLKKSAETMLQHLDYAFASDCAVDLVNIFLHTGDLKEAGYWIDLATATHFRPKYPRNNYLFYEAKCKYWLAVGNPVLSRVYLDSMLMAREQRDEEFNAIVLLRMDQKELAKQQRELAIEKEIRQQIQLRFIILSVGFVVILGLLGAVYLLYRKKQVAYRALVIKTQQWAQVPSPNIPNESHQQLFDQLNRLVTEQRLYLDPDVSLDSVALLMKVNRVYLSQAVNRCTDENFSTYLNEFRVKEAVRLMSDPKSQVFSIDGVAVDAGFNDRITFYRVFKKMTGVSPSTFRSNIK